LEYLVVYFSKTGLLMKKILFMMTLSACSSIYANSPNGAQTVASVGIHDTGHAIVGLNGGSHTENCFKPASVKNAILIPKDHPQFKAIYTTSMAAFLSGSSISAWVNGCTDVWGNGTLMVPTVQTLHIQK
jgi:hypothetical protein